MKFVARCAEISGAGVLMVRHELFSAGDEEIVDALFMIMVPRCRQAGIEGANFDGPR